MIDLTRKLAIRGQHYASQFTGRVIDFTHSVVDRLPDHVVYVELDNIRFEPGSTPPVHVNCRCVTEPEELEINITLSGSDEW